MQDSKIAGPIARNDSVETTQRFFPPRSLEIPAGQSSLEPREQALSRTVLFAGWLTVAMIAAALPYPAFAGGFSTSEQGAKGTGLAGAYVAMADDPTTLFYNPGGLAFVEGKLIAVGTQVAATNESLFQGLPPGLGTESTGEQDTSFSFPVQAFALKKGGEKGMVGVGIYSPYSFNNEWANVDAFSGRSVASGSELTTYDFVPSVGWQLTPNLGIGGGIVYRLAELSVQRRFLGLDPSSGLPVDFAGVDMTTDMEGGFGFQAGLLHQLTERLSWGLCYRTGMTIDFTGTATLAAVPTGSEQLDALIAASLPIGEERALSSRLELPETATLGFGYWLSPALRIEVDAEWTAWSQLQGVNFDFVSDPLLDTTYPLRLSDTTTIRAGLLVATATGTEFRFGLALDESPQPDETVGPFLVDSDRLTLALGFGRDWLDVAFRWNDYDQRIVTTSLYDLNGNYRQSSWLLAITAKM